MHSLWRCHGVVLIGGESQGSTFQFWRRDALPVRVMIGLRVCPCSSWLQNKNNTSSIIGEYDCPHPLTFASHAYSTRKHVHHSGNRQLAIGNRQKAICKRSNRFNRGNRGTYVHLKCVLLRIDSHDSMRADMLPFRAPSQSDRMNIENKHM